MPWFIILIGAAFLFRSKAVGKEGMYQDPFFQWDDLINRYALKYKVPFNWVKAIMMNESDLGNAASVRRGMIYPNDIEGSKSSDGKSWGLMQLTLDTARMFDKKVTVADLNNPEKSIDLGTQYLAYLIKLKGLNEEAVSRSYNGGPGYLSTLKGQTDTPGYYARFRANIAKIQSYAKK